jgi:hypothetical protein
MKEAGDRKETWYRKMQDHGVRVKLVLDANAVLDGMIQYVPIENSVVEGREASPALCHRLTRACWSRALGSTGSTAGLAPVPIRGNDDRV